MVEGTGTNSTFSVSLGSDYFLVNDYSTNNPCSGFISPKTPISNALLTNYTAPASNIYIVKKVGDTWRDLNQGECIDPSTCIKNTGAGISTNPGPYKRSELTQCMAFDKNLFVTAGSDMFHLIDGPSAIIFSYIKTPSGVTFNLSSDKYLTHSNNSTSPASSMKWAAPIIEPIKIQKDYFIVKTKSGSNSQYDIMHYDGVNFRRIGYFGLLLDNSDPINSDVNIYLTSNYFLVTNQFRGTITAYFKAVTKSGGVPTLRDPLIL